LPLFVQKSENLTKNNHRQKRKSLINNIKIPTGSLMGKLQILICAKNNRDQITLCDGRYTWIYGSIVEPLIPDSITRNVVLSTPLCRRRTVLCLLAIIASFFFYFGIN
jgi:hypothetical protein